MSALLHGKERSSFTNSTRRKIREQDRIPAILYGKDLESKAISIDRVEFIKSLREQGRNAVFNMKLDDEEHAVMVNEIQRDPLKDDIIHVDFYAINMESKVEVEVNVQLTGQAQGIKDGGVLQQPLHQVKLRAKPAEIPTAIEVDISTLGVNEALHVKDIQTNGKYEILNEPEEVIVTILPPKQEEEINSGEKQEQGKPDAVEEREND
ncbi:50S ribosomal protein L25/general stress protein Ctc [Aeribacillus alveayuensis]|jgi:large subunit ribosomal protein L25|uniref:Large ribosomal subunit protein bL25 n=1 Tax=Aeribacillus alveayuensis TaxID=279215 RepID=A0ABT9VR94_9BACI|nr:large subunit ribosomal protein L25 [Bacillus alveayuensis]